jgi:6-phosphogluconolactonase (cycloisomerase 2 family)
LRLVNRIGPADVQIDGTEASNMHYHGMSVSPLPPADDIYIVIPTGRFAYATNHFDNDVSGYTIDATTGALTAIAGSPFDTGIRPQNVAIDPTGRFAYVVNQTDKDIRAYGT